MRSTLRRAVRPVLCVALVLATMLAVLGLGVPWAVQGWGVPLATRLLHREVSIERASFNPWTWALTIHGLRIPERTPTQRDFVQVQRIVLDVSPHSLWRWAPVFDAVHFESPRVSVVRTDASRFNLSDLLEPPPDEVATSPGLARFALNDVVVHGGELHYEDKLQGSHHVIKQIEFSLPSVASFDDAMETSITPLLSAQLHGGSLRLGAQSKPFKANRETTLHLSLTGLDLAAAFKASPVWGGWRMHKGTFETQWQLTMRSAASTPAELAPKSAAVPAVAARPAAPPTPTGLVVLAQAKLQLRDAVMSNPQGDRLSAAQWQLGTEQLALHLDAQGVNVRLDDAKLALQGVQLKDGRAASLLAEIGALEVAQITVDSFKRLLSVGRVQLTGASFLGHRARDGRLNWADFWARLPASNGAATPPTPNTGPWSVEVDHLAVSQVAARWHDEAAWPGVDIGFKAMQGEVRHASTRPEARIEHELQAEFVHGGTLQLKGHVQAQAGRASTRVQVAGLNLAQAQPYLSELLNLQVSAGRFSAVGQLDLEQPPRGLLRVSYQGQAEIADLYAREPETQDDFLRWKRMTARGLDIAVTPARWAPQDHVRVGAILFQDPYAKLVISPGGQVNLQHIVKAKATAGGAATATPTVAAPPLPIEIGGVKVVGGRINFTDLLVQPHYTSYLTDLSGSVSALGTQSLPAQLALTGRMEGQAPLTIEGQLDLWSKLASLDIRAQARGIDLPMFTPYAAKYVGYAIERGKLSLDVKYKLEQGKLEAENGVFLDQLTFGEPIASPTATKLPVLFAVALLKNSRGEIDLHLPVQGTLNDPEFSFRAVVWQALGNLIQRAATSPFRLLSSLVSGGEGQLGEIDFLPGTAELTATSKARLGKLMQALVERPGLKLDVIAQVDPVREVGDIRRARLMARVQAERAEQLGLTQTEPLTERLSESEHAQWVQKVYDKARLANKPRSVVGLPQKITVPEMESLLMVAIVVTEADLKALAQERARATRELLLTQVAQERIFTLAPVISAGQKSDDHADSDPKCTAACVRFELH